MFYLKDQSNLRRCNKFFDTYWQEEVMAKNVIRVPQGCPTVYEAVALAKIFSERSVYSKEKPLKIDLAAGEHKIGPSRIITTILTTASNITFVGKGKDKTTIHGGILVLSGKNVKFEALTVTNPSGTGLYFEGSETNAEVSKCVVKRCGESGMSAHVGATVTATDSEFTENKRIGVAANGTNTKVTLNNCTMHHNLIHGLLAGRRAHVAATDCAMHHNEYEGLTASERAVVDIYGTKTDIYANGWNGMHAGRNGQINIRLPLDHNTSHDNVNLDRKRYVGGRITFFDADGTPVLGFME